jgi:heptosyltransferase-2
MAEPRFLLFRNGSIGNTLIAIPAIRAIRQTFPDARLSLILDSTGAVLLKNCPLVNEILIYDKQGRHRGAWATLSFALGLRRRGPTHAILFKRFFRNGLLAFLSGARERIGFETNGSAPFLNRTVLYQEGRPIVELNLELAFLLGADKSSSRELELWFDRETETAGRDFRSKNELKEKDYAAVCLSGITSPPNYLTDDQWREVVQRINKTCEHLVFLGMGAERLLAEKTAASLHAHVVHAFDLPILVMADMIRNARLFVGTDSGPAHIADAVHTPGLIFFRPDENVRLEIQKWCPKGAHHRPLVPPKNPNEMPAFLDQVEEAIIDVLR